MVPPHPAARSAAGAVARLKTSCVRIRPLAGRKGGQRACAFFSLIDASWVREPSSCRNCSVFMVFFFSLVAELGVASRRLHYSGAMREPVARTGAHAKHVTSGVRPGRPSCCEGVTVCSVGQAAHTTVPLSSRVPPGQSQKRSHSHTDISARRPLSTWHVLCGREDRSRYCERMAKGDGERQPQAHWRGKKHHEDRLKFDVRKASSI